MKTNQWILDMIQDNFNHKNFNQQYQTLAVLGKESGENEMAINVIQFLSDIQGFFEDTQENLVVKNENENHCPMCDEKDKIIQLLKTEIDKNEKVINVQHDAIFGKNTTLKVCEK